MTRTSSPTRNTVLEPDRLGAVREAALDTSYVSLGSRRTASPHEFYRYPARFSPSFARATIDAFTQPGDFVLDPFVGGGTTAVEARLSGRLAVGSDLNPLAVLVSLAKARPRSPKELQDVSRWIDRLPTVLSERGRIARDEWSSTRYFRNIDAPELSGIRNALIRARRSLDTIYHPAGEALARCVLLRAGQWALDMRIKTPPRDEFCEKLVTMAQGMVDVAHQYRCDVRVADQGSEAGGFRRTSIIRQPLAGLADRIGRTFSSSHTDTDLTPVSRRLRELPPLESLGPERDACPVLDRQRTRREGHEPLHNGCTVRSVTG